MPLLGELAVMMHPCGESGWLLSSTLRQKARGGTSKPGALFIFIPYPNHPEYSFDVDPIQGFFPTLFKATLFFQQISGLIS